MLEEPEVALWPEAAGDGEPLPAELQKVPAGEGIKQYLSMLMELVQIQGGELELQIREELRGQLKAWTPDPALFKAGQWRDRFNKSLGVEGLLPVGGEGIPGDPGKRAQV
jgi:hypothetical protein